MATVPPFTQAPGGFITVQSLPDGRLLIEGWVLSLDPFDGGEPRTEPAYGWIATTQEEATDLIAEFTRHLTRLAAA